MAPYLEYPQLLSVLLRMLNEGEGSPHIRREVLKVIVFSGLRHMANKSKLLPASMVPLPSKLSPRFISRFTCSCLFLPQLE
jgi:hypothetical protein